MSSTRRSRQLSGTPTEHVAAAEAYRDEFDRNMKQFHGSINTKRCGSALDALVNAAKAKQGIAVSTRWSGRKERTLDVKRKDVSDHLRDMTAIFHSHCVRK